MLSGYHWVARCRAVVLWAWVGLHRCSQEGLLTDWVARDGKGGIHEDLDLGNKQAVQ